MSNYTNNTNDESMHDWFTLLTDRLRDYSDGEIWTDGTEILCRTESAANCISDMLWTLYRAQKQNVTILTGYYSPDEDRRNNEEDRYTGWWYVTLD